MYSQKLAIVRRGVPGRLRNNRGGFPTILQFGYKPDRISEIRTIINATATRVTYGAKVFTV